RGRAPGYRARRPGLLGRREGSGQLRGEGLMAATLPEALRAPITDLASGKAWLEALSAADLTFHLEDDPADIVSGLTGERTFRDEDVPLLRRRVAELYRLDWGIYDCPIGYTLVLCAEAGRIPFWTAGDLIEYANGLEAEVVKVGADAN